MAAVGEHEIPTQVRFGVLIRLAGVLAEDGQRLDGIGHGVPVRRIAIPRLERENLAHFIANKIPRRLEAEVKALHMPDLKKLARTLDHPTSSSTSSIETPIGFSQSTCLPASRARRDAST